MAEDDFWRQLSTSMSIADEKKQPNGRLNPKPETKKPPEPTPQQKESNQIKKELKEKKVATPTNKSIIQKNNEPLLSQPSKTRKAAQKTPKRERLKKGYCGGSKNKQKKNIAIHSTKTYSQPYLKAWWYLGLSSTTHWLHLASHQWPLERSRLSQCVGLPSAWAKPAGKALETDGFKEKPNGDHRFWWIFSN